MISPVQTPDQVLESLTKEEANALLHKLTLIHNALFSPNSGSGFFQFGMLCEKLSTVAKKNQDNFKIRNEIKKEV